jgi:outer membrane scaffolding protein for murein synthesis (MipA/OmpV family)
MTGISLMTSSFFRPLLGAALIGASASAAFAGGLPSDWQVGGAAVVTPKYEGSKEYEVIGFPIVAPAGSLSSTEFGAVQFRGLDDIRLRVFQYQGFEFGPLAGYHLGRDEDDGDLLDGIGDVDGGLVLGAYTAYDFGGIKPFVSYHHIVTGDVDGGYFRFGAESKIPVAGTTGVTLVAGATYASGAYMDEYFSISAAQSAASVAGLAMYEADAGIKDLYIGAGTDIPLTDVWSLKLAAQYTHLLGDASDSPIVETDSQFTGLVGLTYRFSR